MWEICYTRCVPFLFRMLTHLEVKKTPLDNNIVIFSFDGELDETNVDSTFGAIIKDIGDFSQARIIFNFQNLLYLNSKSIGYIADISQRSEEAGGKFALVNLNNEVHDTLDLVGITSVVLVFNSEEAVMAEMQADL